MPMCCVVYGCANRSNREKNKSYYRVPKVVAHKGENVKKLTEKRRKMWLESLRLRRRAAESANARVCSDHFFTGCPGALNDVESADWAPTLNLGYQKMKPMPEEWRKDGTKRTKSRDDQHRHTEAAEALLDLHEAADNTEMLQDPQDAECQTDLTMDGLKKMEDVLKRTRTERGDHRTKAVDTQLCQVSFPSNSTNCYVLMQVFPVV